MGSQVGAVVITRTSHPSFSWTQPDSGLSIGASVSSLDKINTRQHGKTLNRITSDISFKLIVIMYQHWFEKMHLLFQFLSYRSFCLFSTILTLVRRVDNTLWTTAGESNIKPLIMDGRKPMESRSIQILHIE